MAAAGAGAVLIVNPFSTRVSPERVDLVERVLGRHAKVTVELTRHPGHATELAAAASGSYDAILVFSGDGTYNEALNGAAGDVPFGFLPGGGTSVVPRALGFPRDPVEAAERVGRALAAGRTRRISVGSVNGRRFWFSAGIGIDAEAVRRVERRGRTADGARPGDLAFVRAFLELALEHRGRWRDELELEGVGRAAFALVSKSDPYTYAGPVPLRLTPAARFELGLDFVSAPAIDPVTVARVLRQALTGRPARRLLQGHDLDRLVVRCDRPLPLQADGESLGEVREAVFEAHRAAVDVLVEPPGAAGARRLHWAPDGRLVHRRHPRGGRRGARHRRRRGAP